MPSAVPSPLLAPAPGRTADALETARAAVAALPGMTVAALGLDGRPIAGHELATAALARWPERIRAALAGAPWSIQAVPVAADRLADMSVLPVAGGVLVVARDVTAAHRDRELLENSSNVVMRADAQAIYTYVSPTARRIFGWAPEEMVGRPIHDFILAADHERLARMRAALAGGSAEEVVELRVPRPDGGFLWVESRCRALRDRDGGLAGVQTSARDISDRKAAEAARTTADTEFRTAFDDAAIGMALVAPDGGFMRVNEALCDIVGYAPAELAALTFQDITHPEDCDTDVALAREVLSGGRRTYQLEKRYIRSDGSLVWVLLSVSLVRDAAGAPLHFISQIQDISERKRLEAELHRLATEDDLTGLRNRRSFEAALEHQVARCARYGERAAILLLDLDGFKAVNDTHGHLAGDRLLQHVAAVLRARLRAGDVVARLGGDEFAALLPHVDGDEAARIAAGLEAALAAEPVRYEGAPVTARASIGVAAIDPAAGGERSLRDADRAMYEVKRSRRWNAAAPH
ncbi:MAG: PAS domain S-box protein [Solirubrobacteraceae bacterium]